MTTFKLYDYNDERPLGSGEKLSYSPGDADTLQASLSSETTIEDRLVPRPTLTLKVQESPKGSNLWLENEDGERVYVKVDSRNDDESTITVKGVFAPSFVGEK